MPSESFRTNRLVIAIALLLQVVAADAATYSLASGQDALIGQVKTIPARAKDTLMDIARRHDLGHREIRRANPDVDIWIPGEGTSVTIPSQFLLPDAPREGIVLNRGEMRLYYYHEDPKTGQKLVSTYPVGIGREDRQTPVGRSQVIMKLKDPAWYPDKAVQADYAAKGKVLPAVVPPGPENPLGQYALQLDIPGYLIHGTNRPDGIGMRVSRGCVRLYPEDIETLVARVPKWTGVTIVDQPVKVGLNGGDLLIEVDPPVYPERSGGSAQQEQEVIRRIADLLDRRGGELRGDIDWDLITKVVRRADGIPTVVSRAAFASRAEGK